MTSEAADASVARQAETALQDLHVRTLSHIGTLVGRLVYVASTRDYNSGVYCHDGLELRFDPASAQAALAACHQSLFRELLSRNLRQFVEELDLYLDAASGARDQIMRAWQQLRAYQLLIPVQSDPVSAELFISNMKLALATLHLRHSKTGGESRTSDNG